MTAVSPCSLVGAQDAHRNGPGGDASTAKQRF